MSTHRVETRWNIGARLEGKLAERCRLVISIRVPFSRRNPFRKRIEKASIEESRESYQLWLKLAQRHIETLGRKDEPKKPVKRAQQTRRKDDLSNYEDIRASLAQLPPENRRKIEEMLKLNDTQGILF